MIVVGHLCDESTGWDQRVALHQLIERLPRDRFDHRIAVVGRVGRSSRRSFNHPVQCIPRVAGLHALAAPGVVRFVRRHGIRILQAWSPSAAVAARAGALERVPLVLQCSDPSLAARSVKCIRALVDGSGVAVCCSSQIVRRRLVEGGVHPTATVVVRPGVDFSVINRHRRGGGRDVLGLDRQDYVVVLPEPVTRCGGHFDAVMAAAMLNDRRGDIRVILPCDSRAARRIGRIADRLPVPRTVVRPAQCMSTEQLITLSDAMVIAARGDVSTTSVAWAMAAGVAVIGGATYAVAELIANKVNGLLFKQTPGEPMIVSIARLLRDRDAQRRYVEAARGQAFEVFGLRRFAEQTMRLYENMLSGASPGEGIVDSAHAA